MGVSRRTPPEPETVRRLAGELEPPLRAVHDVYRRCDALRALADLGPDAQAALPAVYKQLMIPIRFNGAQLLRVAAAEAAWKIGGRADLSLPFLTFAARDEYWGAAREAVRVLGEIGDPAAIPDLIWLAERRLRRGTLHFEESEALTGSFDDVEHEPILLTVAQALGRCLAGVSGRCDYNDEACSLLLRLSAVPDDRVQAAAVRALGRLAESGRSVLYSEAPGRVAIGGLGSDDDLPIPGL